MAKITVKGSDFVEISRLAAAHAGGRTDRQYTSLRKISKLQVEWEEFEQLLRRTGQTYHLLKEQKMIVVYLPSGPLEIKYG
jgi:hypothetical protein